MKADGLVVKLVGARVERANHQIPTLERFHRATIRAQVEVLVGLAVLVEELGTVEADSRRPPLEGSVDLLRKLDVGR